jgi:Mg2+ and Co2+ transporter CorA
VLARFTFITISLLPCVFISGFFGMNVKVPFMTGSYDAKYPLAPFFTIVAFCLIATAVAATVARYLKYI